MKRTFLSPSDRIARLKQRLGLPAKKWTIQIKRGGWLSLAPPVMTSLRLTTGLVIAWEFSGNRIEWRVVSSQPARFAKFRPKPRPLSKNESMLCTWRPAYRICPLSKVPPDSKPAPVKIVLRLGNKQ